MSVCTYYLRGRCRYGTGCRLLHDNPHDQPMHTQNNPQPRSRHPRPSLDPKYNYVASSNATNNHQVGNQETSNRRNSKFYPLYKWTRENFADKDKALDILQQMQTEANIWLRSSLWRFTSRSLFPGGQPLELWNDQSFEEVKWAYRTYTSQNQEHLYKKAFYEYYEAVERQLRKHGELDLDTMKSLKPYIDQYIASHHKPSKTLPSDIEMKDDNSNVPSISNAQLTHLNTNSALYTPHESLLEDERAAFEQDTFELGQIPTHPPPQRFC